MLAGTSPAPYRPPNAGQRHPDQGGLAPLRSVGRDGLDGAAFTPCEVGLPRCGSRAPVVDGASRLPARLHQPPGGQACASEEVHEVRQHDLRSRRVQRHASAGSAALNLIGQRHDLRKAVCLCPILRSRCREPLGAQGSQLPLAVGRKLSVPGADSAWRDAHDGRQIRNGSCAQDRLVFRHF